MSENDVRYPWYPIALQLEERLCTVIGGGEVAARKVNALLEHGARVRVVSPDLCRRLSELAASGRVEVRRHTFVAGDLEGSFAVFAATDDREVNRTVAAEARARALLVNAADDAAVSDFIIPSSLRREDLTITVSTSGRSPALARKIRTSLECAITEEYAALLDIVAAARAELKERHITVDGERWQKALDLESLLTMVNHGRSEEARLLLIERITGDDRPGLG